MRDFFYDLFRCRKFRITCFWCGLLLLLFISTDWYHENRGIPEFAAERIRRAFEKKGYTFSAESVKAGFIRGIVVRKLRISGSSSQIALTAEKAVLKLQYSQLFRGTMLPLALTLDSGTLSIPVFPEYGEEASCDRISFTGLRTVMHGVPGMLRIRSAEARFNGMLFRMQGDVNNLLHFSGVRSMEMMKRYFSREPAASGSDEYIAQIPLAIRRAILNTLEKIDSKHFSSEPVCDIFFKWDMTDLKKCVAEVNISFPSFSYGKLKVRSISEKIFLKNGIISVDPVRMELPDGSWIEASARYSEGGTQAGGTFSASCGISELLLFFPDPAQSILRSKLGKTPGRVSMKGSLSEFNAASGKFGGKLLIEIPLLTVSGTALKDALFEIEASEGCFRGVLKNAKLSRGGSLSGTFEFDGKRFQTQLEGSTCLKDTGKFLSEEINRLISENLKQKEDLPIAFKGTLTSEDWEKKDFSGKFDVMIPGIRMKQIDIKRLTATIEFSPDSIRIIGMDALLSDKSHLRGDLYCNPLEETLSAKIICAGNPEKIIASIGKEYRNFFTSVTGEIVWPKEEHSIEFVSDLHFTYGKNPSHYLSGSVMLRDFKFRNIFFRYGGARFILRNDNVVLFPDIVLETADGRMSLRGAYEQKEPFDPARDLSGILKFTMSSTIRGDDMIRCLYPKWTGEYIGFPEKIRVEAEGLIDYGNLSRTNFTAQVMNGTSVWNKMPIRDIDVSLRYADDTFFFQRAEGLFCGGRLSLDYRYQVEKDCGKISLQLNNADMNEFLKLQKFPAVSNKKTSFSSRMKGDFSYTEKDELLLNGNASFELTGPELWSVPLLGPFLRVIGEAWTLDGLGAITKVNGSFLFQNDTMTIDKFQSDGGVVAIGAKGYYKWTPGDFDVTFQAILLKNTLPFNAMSKLLQPVSWMLEKRFKGNIATYEWVEKKNEKK